MAQWPARTWTIGELITGGMFNSVRDGLNELHSQIRPNGGLWTDVPFVQANFYPPSGAWTITPANIVINRYTQIGKLVIWTIHVSGSTLTAAPTYLYMMPPVPAVPTVYGAHASAALNGNVSLTHAYIYKDPASPYGVLLGGPGQSPAFAAGGFSVAFTWLFEAAAI